MIFNTVVVCTKMAYSSGNYGKFVSSIGSKGLLDKALLFYMCRRHNCNILSRL